MIATTFRGESVYLLGYSPNWKTRPRVGFTKIGDISPGLTGTESRWSLANTMRVRFEFELFLRGKDSADFRVGLQRQAALNRRVLVPFWPGAVNYYSGGAVYTNAEGEFYVATGSGETYVSSTGEGCWLPTDVWLTFERDWSSWEIHETDMPTGFAPTATAIRVPLMLGVFEEPPDPVPATSTLITCPIRFLETSPADMALVSVPLAFEDGPAVAGRTPKIFPLAPNWALPLKAGSATVEIDREQIGFGRSPAEVYYPQPARRALQMGFTAPSWDKLARLIAFFFQCQGMIESFWIQGLCDEVVLTSASSGSSAVVNVDRAASLGDSRYIVFDDGVHARVFRKVLSVDTGANTLTLDAAPGVFHPAQTRITALILGRFARPDLSVSFLTDRVGECSTSFIETPNEYIVPVGETPGITSGALARKAYLFRFRQEFPDGPHYWRFTSYEQRIIAAGETFVARPIEHSESVEDVDIEKSKMSIRSRAFEGNPLLQYVPFRIEVPLLCEVLTCSPDDDGIAGTPTLIFSGEVSEPQFNGPLITCNLTSPFKDLAQPLPLMLLQPGCNHRLFSRGCGLIESDWTFSASVVSVSGNAIVINTITRLSGSVPTLTADWFALGRIWFGAAENYASRAIYGSTAISSGAITLTISHPFTTAPAGTVYFTPGCDGAYSTCHEKFNNRPRFGGFPFLPSGNPSLVAIRSEQPQGGKK